MGLRKICSRRFSRSLELSLGRNIEILMAHVMLSSHFRSLDGAQLLTSLADKVTPEIAERIANPIRSEGISPPSDCSRFSMFPLSLLPVFRTFIERRSSFDIAMCAVRSNAKLSNVEVLGRHEESLRAFRAPTLNKAGRANPNSNGRGRYCDQQ